MQSHRGRDTGVQKISGIEHISEELKASIVEDNVNLATSLAGSALKIGPDVVNVVVDNIPLALLDGLTALQFLQVL
jgi:hypothetical protein